MIVRIFRVRIHSGLMTQFEKKFQEISLPLVKSQSGLVSLSAGKPTEFAPEEYVLITTWKSESALREFAGDSWNKPVIPHGMEKFVAECWVHHYEIFEQA